MVIAQADPASACRKEVWMGAKDKFSQLLEDLISGDLSHNHIQIAYRAALREREDIPEGVRNLLGGTSSRQAGVISLMFRMMSETIGSMELAYRRGYQHGQEDCHNGTIKFPHKED